ncbi:hypothetical protein E0H80_06445 [Acinetobacter sp. ANC 4779]|uniref:hypothetical protein n=1 Tax=Acinetobacter sp. ANC 4779 TaxID=2529848 RepID=UPI001039E72B|nr:hypothetical protein [Acinetobacter sp. ANC 4779]TCB51001.1 hypothetical protein E0H80_06445 [Acinetobacter sp. ANC 4779]
MNAQTKPELFAPCFPIFWLKDESIEVDAGMVRFTLMYGCVEFDCEMLANELSDWACVELQFDPEGGRDVPYTKLKIDNKTLALVTRSDLKETPAGLNFILTEYQVGDLNAQLEAKAVEKFELKQGA